ncbi:MAG: imidazole glycerol phosphate synthase subunit HisF [Prevotellaceae bacterium]|jgi:cyclase|nr:imidazole glycerol phosphate synthase subunit HisF [Prevotellaceae bacterium]
MLKKRIIPCLDIKDGRTVKGTNFIDLKDAGDPVELASRYAGEGADELVFLDITATVERRKTLAELVTRIAAAINIPFTVGGGVASVGDAQVLIRAGADKIGINSAAVKNPALARELAAEFGSQCVVAAIDTKNTGGSWQVFVNGGRTPTGIDTLDWARKLEELGAGEILLTSMNNDGTRSGFALDITAAVASALNIPVIASGGAGSCEDFLDVFARTGASAALAAGIFHYGELGIAELKRFLASRGTAIRTSAGNNLEQ